MGNYDDRRLREGPGEGGEDQSLQVGFRKNLSVGNKSLGFNAGSPVGCEKIGIFEAE